MDIRDEVRRLVREQLGWGDHEDIADDVSKKDLGFDYLDDVEIIIAIENFFEIEMHDNEIENLDTINDIVAYLEARLRS